MERLPWDAQDGKWATRALELTIALGSADAAAPALSVEMQREVTRDMLTSMLRRRFSGWQRKVAAFRPEGKTTDPDQVLRDRARFLEREVRDLNREIEQLQEKALTDEMVKREILGLATADPKVPQWVTTPRRKSASGPGTPSVLAGDWHWAEKVEPAQVFGKNAYDLKTAHARAKRFFEGTVDVFKNHTVRPDYPGIVVSAAGDMFSGSIHEELTETNEIPIMPAVLDLLGVWEWGLDLWRKEFGRVFVAWVRGNHTRTTKKPIAKNAAHTSYDWLVGKLLERHYKDEEDITFLVPDGPDAYYRVYDHRYYLTHCDQWKGGDGIIGALGPVARGDTRTRSRNTQVDMGYDTLLGAHWHQYIPLPRLIITGAFKGYDEYAWKAGFPFDVPKQAAWLTHPLHGITFSMPILLEKPEKRPATDWIRVAA